MKWIKHGIRRAEKTSDLIVIASAGNYRVSIYWKALKADVKVVVKGILMQYNQALQLLFATGNEGDF